MKTSSRRKFIRAGIGGAAVFAVSPTRSLWAQSTDLEDPFESELTGSLIEIKGGDWYFFLENYEIIEQPEFTKEHVQILNQSCTLDIDFVQTNLAPEQYLQIVQDEYRAGHHEFEIADSGVTDDGAWFAASSKWEEYTLSIFAEYQVGAYDETDLVIIANSRPGDFQQNIASIQQDIVIGDLEPLLMVDSSQVLALSFPVLTDDTTATSTNSRNSRSTRGSSGDEETSETNNRDNQRGQSQNGSSTTSDYPADVRAHRAEFMGSFEEFAGALGVFVDETSTSAQQDAAFATIDRVAESWRGYPARAAQLRAPAEYASLEAAYSTWANEIAALGNSYFAAMSGTGSVDQMFDQIDAVEQADIALAAELGA